MKTIDELLEKQNEHVKKWYNAKKSALGHKIGDTVYYVKNNIMTDSKLIDITWSIKYGDPYAEYVLENGDVMDPWDFNIRSKDIADYVNKIIFSLEDNLIEHEKTLNGLIESHKNLIESTRYAIEKNAEFMARNSFRRYDYEFLKNFYNNGVENEE